MAPIVSGDNLFANSLIALDAATGKRIWHFQMVRHDIWDRDLPSPPSLVTVRANGRDIDAVAQATKHGYLFLFDRVDRRADVSDRIPDVPARVTCPAKSTSRMQPIPTRPRPFARQLLTEDGLTTRTPEVHGPGRWSSSRPSAAKASSCRSRRTGRPSCFRASTAARSGAARRSIPRAASIT